jgi:hypothetical protein
MKVKLKDAYKNDIAYVVAHQNWLGAIGHQCWADPPVIQNPSYQVPPPFSINNATSTPGQVLVQLMTPSSN